MDNFTFIEQSKVKHRILQELKTGGSQTAAAIAERLQVTPMAIRQHLQDLQAEGWVAYDEERRPVGRPVKLWQLTDRAMRLFPDSHGDLSVGLLQGIERLFGADGLAALMLERARLQIQTYTARMAEGWDWRTKVNALAVMRSQEGYMAEAFAAEDNSMLLVENHCSIYAAAESCQQFCGTELEVFTAVLGADVTIERVEHIMRGDRRCAYRIRAT